MRLYCNTDTFRLKEERSRAQAAKHLSKIMSEEHKMTEKDKLVLTITLAIIFLGVFALGLVGLIFNLSG